MAAFSLPLWSQIIAFVIVSVILLILTRPWALKYLNSRTVRTNADSLIGQTALVTQDIDNLNAKGQVKDRYGQREVFPMMYSFMKDRRS